MLRPGPVGLVIALDTQPTRIHVSVSIEVMGALVACAVARLATRMGMWKELLAGTRLTARNTTLPPACTR